MKKIITVLLIMISATVLKAQEQTFTQAIDSVFQFVSSFINTKHTLSNK